MRPPRLPLLALLALNVFLAVVAVWTGDPAFLVAAAWAECAVVALWAIPKTWVVARRAGAHKPAVAAVVTALLSVGALVVFGAVYVLLHEGSQITIRRYLPAGQHDYALLTRDDGQPVPLHVWIALAAMLASHGVSYLLNFLGHEEWRGMALIEPWRRAYWRMGWIILGVFVALLIIATISEVLRGGSLHVDPGLGARLGMVLVVFLLKSAADVWGHGREHRDQRT